MLAVLLRGPREVAVEEVPDPEPPPGWVKLAVRAVGICGTDKAMYTGAYRPPRLPLIPGHEVAGTVDEVGEGISPDLIGKLVVPEINITCGRCWFCTHGLREHCLNRRAIGISADGGMAEYLVVPAENIHLAEGLSPSEAAFAEPLAAVLKMLVLEPPRPGCSVAVLGIGTLGLLAIQIIRRCAPDLLVAIARPGSPKARLARSLGADEVLTPDEAEELVKNSLPGKGFDYVVEATGSTSGLDLAIKLARPRGVVAVKSTHGRPTTINATLVAVKELRIVGSRCGPFEPALRLLREGAVRVRELVTATYRLEEAREAFEASLRREHVKVQVVPGH
ncbi:alcohol dehydrogenase [Candidatus Bathyarchaeota archaeon]|nr:MAG: alcohol dehydrogenase [Candidatus Bathyarchaeota archaeon]